MSQLNKWMGGGKISKLVVVITDKDSGDNVERWQFDVSIGHPHPLCLPKNRLAEAGHLAPAEPSEVEDSGEMLTSNNTIQVQIFSKPTTSKSSTTSKPSSSSSTTQQPHDPGDQENAAAGAGASSHMSVSRPLLLLPFPSPCPFPSSLLSPCPSLTTNPPPPQTPSNPTHSKNRHTNPKRDPISLPANHSLRNLPPHAGQPLHIQRARLRRRRQRRPA